MPPASPPTPPAPPAAWGLVLRVIPPLPPLPPLPAFFVVTWFDAKVLVEMVSPVPAPPA
jgi:hypothetical protein